MTGPGAVRIARSDLALGASLGGGGQGKVWVVEKRLINGTWPVAYKEYKPEVQTQLQIDALERMVAFLPGRPAAVGKWLAGHTAWPAALVTEGPQIRGFLMRQIPDEFFMTVPSGDRKAAGFEFLLNPLAFVQKTVGTVTPRQFFGLLLALADILERLHGLGVVAGDLSPKNLLFALSGARPGCFLIDCDAMGLEGDWVLKPVQTPGWALPDGEAPDTQQGDCYKFALLAVRLFLHEQHGQDPAALRRMDTTVGDLAARGLSADPAARPTLSAWLDPLRRAFDTAPVTWLTAAGPTGTGTTGQRTTASPRAGTGPVGGATGGTRPGATRPPSGPVPSYTAPAYVPSPSRPQGSSSGRAATVVAWIVLALIGLGVWQFMAHHSSDSGGSGSGSTGQTRSGNSGTREEQVTALNTLLAGNAGRRSGVSDAVQSMLRCSGLQDARQVFVDAAEARADLVKELGALSVDQLSDDMVSDLSSAWQNSEKADRAYARVVDDVSGSCSSANVVGSSSWQDASSAGDDATAAKQDFVAAWNPVAQEYGLDTLAWTDL
ncbi:hypothetical protein OG194_27115 [Streptomyces sp. NBC_01288]|uniref:hypothetical protein n=1 Tax=Streptomyces sp. NBC_01288 TaxID=2903814 RepID=UPI002E1476FA|nr:hypothetical protein OG194_27115 [Streptomyces sp. NBC_01288]